MGEGEADFLHALCHNINVIVYLNGVSLFEGGGGDGTNAPKKSCMLHVLTCSWLRSHSYM